MSQPPILIFTAVQLEARAIARTLRMTRMTGQSHSWTSPGAHLHIIGIRSVHLPTPLPPARGIILAGLAGALDPSLHVGDIVVDAASCPLPPRDVLPGARIGPIHTAGHLISTPAEKAELCAATHALAVDMENALLRGQIQASIEHRHLPFLHVRAISDSASDSLDPVLMTVIDSRGRPKPLALTAALLRRPTLIAHLRHIGGNSAQAAAALAAAVQTLLRHL